MKRNDISGQKFGKLTVLNYHHTDKNRHSHWNCICECGNTKVINGGSLKRGLTISCGCDIKERNLRIFTTHGLRHSRLYKIYYGMKDRCYNQNREMYKYYGGRGISICDEWKNDFISFYNWSMENGYSDNLTIDRIDSDGNYEPENCRWADKKTQGNNTSRVRMITYNGVTHSLSDWSKLLSINYTTLISRLDKFNYSVEKAFTMPVQTKYINKE